MLGFLPKNPVMTDMGTLAMFLPKNPVMTNMGTLAMFLPKNPVMTDMGTLAMLAGTRSGISSSSERSDI